VIWRASPFAGLTALALLLGGGPGCASSPGAERPDPGVAPASVPFGARPMTYPAGTIFPTVERALLDGTVTAFYDRWKAAYLTAACGGHIVKTGGGTGASDALTVSEGHGYGMVVVAFMVGHDPAARQLFDGLYRVFRASRSGGDQQLMAWALGADCRPIQPATSATDGDLDIAFALLLAHRQWGSAGTIDAVDYLGEARTLIAAIDRSEMNPSTRLPMLGDWAASGALVNATRPSDFMTGHFRVFARISGNASWRTSVDRVYDLVASLQQQWSSRTGLLPDFVADTHTSPRPPPGLLLESENDGQYGWNACRVPWRLGSDFAVSGDARARAALAKMAAWIEGESQGRPGSVVDGYRLDGARIGKGPSAAYIAPFGVAAMVDVAHQRFLDAVWSWLESRPPEGYYADSIRLLSLIVMSGNWWSP
jgi:endoglucanase